MEIVIVNELRFKDQRHVHPEGTHSEHMGKGANGYAAKVENTYNLTAHEKAETVSKGVLQKKHHVWADGTGWRRNRVQ